MKELQNINFLFCSHPLYPRKIDEDYKEEFEEDSLFFDCALFSFEDMEEGRLKLHGKNISGITIYRGWMMKLEMYQQFFEELKKRDIYLINTPDEYSRFHLLPNWYEQIKEYTPDSFWIKLDLERYRSVLNDKKAILKEWSHILNQMELYREYIKD